MTDFPDVRRASEDDQEAVGQLWLQLLHDQAALDERLEIADDALDRWRNDFAVWLADETRRVYVAAPDDGAIEGFVTARRWGPPPIYEDASEVYIDELCVADDAQRSGLGTQLVAAVRHWAETLPAERIRFSVLAANEGGRAFWQALDGTPFSVTMTIELPAADPEEAAAEASRPMGFQQKS
jgi:GNAT superfamily N-acetyltransferase